MELTADATLFPYGGASLLYPAFAIACRIAAGLAFGLLMRAATRKLPYEAPPGLGLLAVTGTH